MTDRSIPTLDGWRAVAILFVMFCHGYPGVQRALGFSYPLESQERLGILGVELFFGLSGYLITTRLLSEESRNGFASLSQFYLRRAFRILPAAILFILVASLLSAAGAIPSITPSRIASSLLFFANYSEAEPSYYLAHFWSLAIEEHFYFVWPAIFMIVAASFRRLSVVIGLAFVVALWRAIDWKYQLSGDTPARFFARTDIQADALLWGAAVAIVAANAYWGPKLRSLLTLQTVWAMTIIISLAIAIFRTGGWKLDFLLIGIGRITIPLAIYGGVLNHGTSFARVLDKEPFRYVGRISYSLYLWQQLFLVLPDDAVARGVLGFFQVFPLNMVAAFSCAIASHHLIEKPVIVLGKKLVSYSKPRPVAAR
jgi:peptidoglycan/LPS O-acetylase OafA/YrhL